MLMGPQASTGGNLGSQIPLNQLASGLAAQKGQFQAHSNPHSQPVSRLSHHAHMNRSMQNMSQQEEMQAQQNAAYHEAMQKQFLENQHKAQALYRQSMQQQKNAGQGKQGNGQKQYSQSFRA